jgi:glycosyltransferase involved in cell wall biosynthesis
MNDYQRPKIFCIVPAFNEEKNILKVLKELKKFIENIIVVDDGSEDKTYDLAKDTGVIVLRHIINRDQGAALETGNVYALKSGADIIVHFDADGQFLANEIKDLLEPLIKNECDIVFGSRFLAKKSNMPWFKKYIIYPLARVVNKIFFGVNLSDPQCGFRAFQANIANKISIEQDGKAHCSEILKKVFSQKLKYKEVPVTVIYNNFGQKFSGGLIIIKDIFLSKLLK